MANAVGYEILQREVTLRDRFAMAALTGIARDSAYTLEGAERAARIAYQFSDSMLAERERVK